MVHVRLFVSAAALRGAGSRILGERLVQALGEREDVDLAAWVSTAWEQAPSDAHRVAAGFRHKLSHELSIPARALSFDAVLSLGDTGCPLPLRPHVLLVQQAHLAYSEADWGYRAPARFRAKLRALEAYFRLGRGGVTRFTVQTEDMKRRLVARWDLPHERVDVIPSSVLPLPDHEPVRGTRPFLACVTSAGPHKNLDVLPDLLAALEEPNLELRVTVDAANVPGLVAQFRRRGVHERVVFEGSVSRARAMSLLAGAECAVIPSVLESFGFGYYEALAVGCPVVAADRGFAREACGDVGVYAQASSGEDFAAGVRSVLAGSRAERSAASRARFAQVARTWDQIAASYVDSIQSAIRS